MTRDDFIAEFAALLDVDPELLRSDTDLKSIEMWDSVAYLSAMVLIDQEFGITMRAEALAKVVTFQDILKVVESAFTN
jgi:acyl carrier protein